MTPVLRPAMNESVKKAKGATAKTNKNAIGIQIKAEEETQTGREILEKALNLMVVK